MVKYGNTLTLMDATYKTTKYALPLFMLVVRTNVGYFPVAEFLLECEAVANVVEALSILKCQNPDWNPPAFLVDYSEVEFQAIKTIFPNAAVLLCYFHVERAWDRYTGSSKYM